MKRIALTVIALALGACAQEVPDSASGVGFNDYESYAMARLERERALRTATPVVPGGRPLATETLGNVDPDIGATEAVAGAPVTTNNPGISDEQDFQAVSARETIQSDAERREAQKEAYTLIQPEALPTRTGGGRPNIVQYALSTSNGVGQQVYRRSGFNADSRFQRACAKYASADQAQEDFLARGGPENDRMGVDPDGDGFACYWDPAPFRTARGG